MIGTRLLVLGLIVIYAMLTTSPQDWSRKDSIVLFFLMSIYLGMPRHSGSEKP